MEKSKLVANILIVLICLIVMINSIVLSLRTEPSDIRQIVAPILYGLGFGFLAVVISHGVLYPRIIPNSLATLVLFVLSAILFLVAQIIMYVMYTNYMTKFHVSQRTEEMCDKRSLEKETLRYAFRDQVLFSSSIRVVCSLLLVLSVICALFAFARISQDAFNHSESMMSSMFNVPLFVLILVVVYGCGQLYHKASYLNNMQKEYKEQLRNLGLVLLSAPNTLTQSKILRERISQRILSDQQSDRLSTADAIQAQLRQNPEGWMGYIRFDKDSDLINAIVSHMNDDRFNVNIQNSVLALERRQDIVPMLEDTQKSLGKYFTIMLTMIGYLIFHILVVLGNMRILWNLLLILVVSLIVFWFGYFPI